MAIRWDWNDKMGEVIYTHGRKNDLFRGNAFCISVYTNTVNKERYYQLAWFAADEQHLKNMLGLNTKEGFEECFSHFEIETLRLNTKYKETAKFVQLLAKAKVNIKIELYKGE